MNLLERARAATATPTRPATRGVVDELRNLVAAVLADAADAERDEAFRVACADPDAALECFRLLARVAGLRART